MDKEFIKTIISTKEGKDDRLIKRGDLVDLEIFELLYSAPTAKIDQVFYKYDVKANKDEAIYYMQIKCPQCECVRVEAVCKSNITDTIKKMKSLESGKKRVGSYFSSIELLCPHCLVEKEERQKIESEKNRKEFAEERAKKNEEYITLNLDCRRSFKDGVSAKVKVAEIMKAGTFLGRNYFLNDEDIQNVIKGMHYKDFLKTPYWDGVRNYKLKKSGYCCELCKSKGVLNIHHKNYQNHGLEHLESIADKDLIVLCKNCHEKFHDKLAEKEVSTCQ